MSSQNNKYRLSMTAQAAYLAASNGVPVHQGANTSQGRDSRYSVAALWTMAAAHDVEVDDELTQSQKKLRDLKTKISAQSKKNFLLERDVRYLDGRIALLIANRMALDEDVTSRLEESESDQVSNMALDDRRKQAYGNLFFMLQTEPKYIATLCRALDLSEIDSCLQTVMFTLYGNQYDSREEYLLLSMFQNVLASTFETASDFGSLLRANTAVSRMMTTYTRRGPGQTYLKHTLSEKIHRLMTERELDLEINPIKVYEKMIAEIEKHSGQPSSLPNAVTTEEAAQNPSVQAIIRPRVETLMEICQTFLNTIMTSLDLIPYGIRWICKQIKFLTRRKFPNVTDEDICSLIGGFFFLRFLNPAIVTPQAYMLVDSNPSAYPKRTLTLIAKTIQNLANKPTYAKEKYMMELAPFLERNKARINQFLNDLCEVGDFYESLEMEQYMALTKKELNINVSLNEMFSLHGLLQKYLESLCPNENQHLRIILTDLGPAPPQLPRSENKTLQLYLFSRFETMVNDVPSAITDSQLRREDLIYMDNKAIFVQMLRLMPSLATASHMHLYKIIEIAGGSRDPNMVKKAIQVKELLSQLEEMGVVDPRDGHRLMVEELKQEIAHLGDMKDTINVELQSLELVYKTILDHNNYLRSQLESYKAYLQNVRTQSGINRPNTSNKVKTAGPLRLSHAQLEREGVIVESNVPEIRRPNIYFNLSSPMPGSFVIALLYKGREKAILEMDLKLDDLLEKQQMGVMLLDLEYVKLSVSKTRALLNKHFLKK